MRPRNLLSAAALTGAALGTALALATAPTVQDRTVAEAAPTTTAESPATVPDWDSSTAEEAGANRNNIPVTEENRRSEGLDNIKALPAEPVADSEHVQNSGPPPATTADVPTTDRTQPPTATTTPPTTATPTTAPPTTAAPTTAATTTTPPTTTTVAPIPCDGTDCTGTPAEP